MNDELPKPITRLAEPPGLRYSGPRGPSSQGARAAFAVGSGWLLAGVVWTIEFAARSPWDGMVVFLHVASRVLAVALALGGAALGMVAIVDGDLHHKRLSAAICATAAGVLLPSVFFFVWLSTGTLGIGN